MYNKKNWLRCFFLIYEAIMFFNKCVKKILSFNLYFIMLIVCLFLLLLYQPDVRLGTVTHKNVNSIYEAVKKNSVEDSHNEIVTAYFEKRKNWNTSNLGSILFKSSPEQTKTYKSDINADRKFIILIWKYFKWLENRHIHNFDSKRTNDPLSTCSVNNCIFTGDDDVLSTADAVVIHIQRGKYPNVTKRNRKQRWVFLNDESPLHAFSMAKYQPKISDFANIFNWSMTFRSDADVPVPYGRTIPLKKPIQNGMTYENVKSLIPYWENKHRDGLVSILISNCGVSRRMDYLKQLQEYMVVDVFGKCSKDHRDSCPGHFTSDCNIMSKYLFYLVFENSECEEYLTEKSFYNAYSKGAIPVIMGPSVNNCELLLPPNSFLHIENYRYPKDLARHMLEISKSDEILLSYHRWRNDFEVLNEHGYFGSKSFHLCRICEALNYNDHAEKIYSEEDLRKFFDPQLSCR